MKKVIAPTKIIRDEIKAKIKNFNNLDIKLEQVKNDEYLCKIYLRWNKNQSIFIQERSDNIFDTLFNAKDNLLFRYQKIRYKRLSPKFS